MPYSEGLDDEEEKIQFIKEEILDMLASPFAERGVFCVKDRIAYLNKERKRVVQHTKDKSKRLLFDTPEEVAEFLANLYRRRR